MKILHVINSLQMGGAEKLISEIGPRLNILGNETDVLVFDGSQTFFMQELKDKKVKVICLWNGQKKPYDIRNLIKMLPIVKNYDIIHSHTTPAQLFAMLSCLFSLSKAKLVTTEHSTNNHRRGKWFYKLLDKWMYGRYEHIICISETAKINLIKQIDNHKNITVIENGIDVEKYHSAVPILRSSINCKETDFIITMVGRFCDAKDQDTIIEAMSYLPQNCKLVLIGAGERQIICQRLVEKLKLNERVLFLGIRNDVPQLLHTSDVIIMSSHWEGLSLSSVEGMSVEKPFIASDVEGLREVVSGAGLLFKEGDSKELAEIILKLRNDNAFYSKIAEQCLQRAQKYDISTMVEKYNEIYQGLEKQ